MYHMTPLKYQMTVYGYALVPYVYKRMDDFALSYSVDFAI